MSVLGPEAVAAAFPLGGIGTGNFAIGARGDYRDWELQNRPGFGESMPYTFFAVRGEAEGYSFARVLEGPIQPPHTQSHGYRPSQAAGLMRFRDSSCNGQYPVGHWTFSDSTLPIEARLEAFTPLVPLDPDRSGIPCAVLRYFVRNQGERTLEVSVAGFMTNPIGGISSNRYGQLLPAGYGTPSNRVWSQFGFTGVSFDSEGIDPGHAMQGEMILSVLADDVSIEPSWGGDPWHDSFRQVWSDFVSSGRFQLGESRADGTEPRVPSSAAISATDSVAPGETAEFRFVLSWWFPNREYGWRAPRTLPLEPDPDGVTIRNHYATRYQSASDVLEHLSAEWTGLERSTYAFVDSIYNSTLPEPVIEALASGVAHLRSTTCFRVEGLGFHGWEGTFDDAGSCGGTCTHVWSYAYTLAALFPSLERSIRANEFGRETDNDGRMSFRSHSVFGEKHLWPWGEQEPEPAADGQMGSVVRAWREWLWSGDRGWLESIWPGLARALDFVSAYWDTDSDGLLENPQHTTYDVEFHGANPLTSVYYLAALSAGIRLAEVLGHGREAIRWKSILGVASAKLDTDLYNGEFYVQDMDGAGRQRHQIGAGCLSDQLLGQLHACLLGLGYVLPKQHVSSAIRSVFKYNFRERMGDQHSTLRVYALGEESGLVLCSWPHGGRPELPFPYADEVWTGVEYQVAAMLIIEGFLHEGLTVVEATRKRHDGVNRNPWDEVECGRHYARALSSWTLLLALSGLQASVPDGLLEFNPVLDCSIRSDRWVCPWSNGVSWGTLTVDSDSQGRRAVVEVLGGETQPQRVLVNGVSPDRIRVVDRRHELAG